MSLQVRILTHQWLFKSRVLSYLYLVDVLKRPSLSLIRGPEFSAEILGIWRSSSKTCITHEALRKQIISLKGVLIRVNISSIFSPQDSVESEQCLFVFECPNSLEVLLVHECYFPRKRRYLRSVLVKTFCILAVVRFFCQENKPWWLFLDEHLMKMKNCLIFLSCEQTNWMMKLPKRLIELMLQRFFLTPLPLIIWFCYSCCYFVARCNKPGLSVFTFYLASVKFKTFHLLLIWTPQSLEKDLTVIFWG